MATFRQIDANQPNAPKSNGPVTADDQAAVQRRMVEWRPSYQPQSAEQEWLFEQVVVSSVRLDDCRDQESHLRLLDRQRAALCWNEDRQAEADELGAQLAKRPALISRRLQKTRQGVEWLIDRWRTLGKLHERNREWTDAQTALAHDLLGTPRELRDGEPFRNPAGLACQQIDILKARLDQALDALDDFERQAAIAGTPLTLSRALSQLRRYEASCRRHYHWALDRLRESLQQQQEQQQAAPVEPPAPVAPPASSAPTTKRSQWDSGQDGQFPRIPTSNSTLAPVDFAPCGPCHGSA